MEAAGYLEDSEHFYYIIRRHVPEGVILVFSLYVSERRRMTGVSQRLSASKVWFYSEIVWLNINNF